ncbi:YceI family protein [Paraliomyxa miuraensis]|uniref:YceI family protein n=1 Tax=Paraliomyxa miuraensis TaxID=376150 RepID=UPI00224F460E|nr:YceI family protein [Paraliomyxa miuraensis]MCX4243712.1 YceI family protein [Paraliomyxa miuraensis]
MPRYDATTAECHVFTFKEGMLSAIAHDLRIRVARFTIDIDAATGAIEARLSADSLRVDCAMKDGREDHGALRDGHKREIEDNIASNVLHVRKHPEIVFRSTKVEGGGLQDAGDERRIDGALSLHGKDRPLRATARRHDDRWVAEVELHQPDFGIKPYSALLGTLKIRANVRVRISVPAGAE